MSAQSVLMLVVARFLAEIAVGVIVSAGMASVVDQGGLSRRRQASLLASVAMVMGAGLGPLMAGALSLLLARPIVPIFSVELVLLLGATVCVAVLPLKHGSARPGDRWRPRLPRVARRNREDILIGIAIFGPGIAATGFVLSLGPSVLSRLLEVQSPLIAGAMACAMFATATAVQFAARGRAVLQLMMTGAGATLLAMVGLCIAMFTSSAAVLVLSALLAGAGQGFGQLGGFTLIALNVDDTRRAEANALLNIGGYIPAGLLPVMVGALTDRAGLLVGATSFAVVLGLVALIGGIAVRGMLRPAASR